MDPIPRLEVKGSKVHAKRYEPPTYNDLKVVPPITEGYDPRMTSSLDWLDVMSVLPSTQEHLNPEIYPDQFNYASGFDSFSVSQADLVGHEKRREWRRILRFISIGLLLVLLAGCIAAIAFLLVDKYKVRRTDETMNITVNATQSAREMPTEDLIQVLASRGYLVTKLSRTSASETTSTQPPPTSVDFPTTSLSETSTSAHSLQTTTIPTSLLVTTTSLPKASTVPPSFIQSVPQSTVFNFPQATPLTFLPQSTSPPVPVSTFLPATSSSKQSFTPSSPEQSTSPPPREPLSQPSTVPTHQSSSTSSPPPREPLSQQSTVPTHQSSSTSSPPPREPLSQQSTVPTHQSSSTSSPPPREPLSQQSTVPTHQSSSTSSPPPREPLSQQSTVPTHQSSSTSSPPPREPLSQQSTVPTHQSSSTLSPQHAQILVSSAPPSSQSTPAFVWPPKDLEQPQQSTQTSSLAPSSASQHPTTLLPTTPPQPITSTLYGASSTALPLTEHPESIVSSQTPVTHQPPPPDLSYTKVSTTVKTEPQLTTSLTSASSLSHGTTTSFNLYTTSPQQAAVNSTNAKIAILVRAMPLAGTGLVACAYTAPERPEKLILLRLDSPTTPTTMVEFQRGQPPKLGPGLDPNVYVANQDVSGAVKLFALQIRQVKCIDAPMSYSCFVPQPPGQPVLVAEGRATLSLTPQIQSTRAIVPEKIVEGQNTSLACTSVEFKENIVRWEISRSQEDNFGNYTFPGQRLLSADLNLPQEFNCGIHRVSILAQMIFDSSFNAARVRCVSSGTGLASHPVTLNIVKKA